MPLQRLDRFISNQLNLSRKEVKEGIKRGFADVNGKTVTRPNIRLIRLATGFALTDRPFRLRSIFIS